MQYKTSLQSGHQTDEPWTCFLKQAFPGTVFLDFYQGLARTQTPTTKNYAPELPTFGVIAGVNQTEVQW